MFIHKCTPHLLEILSKCLHYISSCCLTHHLDIMTLLITHSGAVFRDVRPFKEYKSTTTGKTACTDKEYLLRSKTLQQLLKGPWNSFCHCSYIFEMWDLISMNYENNLIATVTLYVFRVFTPPFTHPSSPLIPTVYAQKLSLKFICSFTNL